MRSLPPRGVCSGQMNRGTFFAKIFAITARLRARVPCAQPGFCVAMRAANYFASRRRMERQSQRDRQSQIESRRAMRESVRFQRPLKAAPNSHPDQAPPPDAVSPCSCRGTMLPVRADFGNGDEQTRQLALGQAPPKGAAAFGFGAKADAGSGVCMVFQYCGPPSYLRGAVLAARRFPAAARAAFADHGHGGGRAKAAAAWSGGCATRPGRSGAKRRAAGADTGCSANARAQAGRPCQARACGGGCGDARTR